jgi:protein AaeX
LKFFEINLLGVYIAPISLLIVAAWFVTVALRRVASRFGSPRRVWDPAVFVLSSMVLVIAW